jgi:hypothetical protein
MKCSNCRSTATRTFDAVPCCADCHELARAACRRAEAQMKALLVLHRDVVRVMMVEGKLRVSSAADIKSAIDRVPDEVPRVPQGAAPRPGPQSESR